MGQGTSKLDLLVPRPSSLVPFLKFSVTLFPFIRPTSESGFCMTIAEYNQSVDDFSDGIYRFILKNIKNHEMAKDVVQDTYEKLWVRVAEVSPEKVRSYLFTTAYHTMIDLIRKENRMEDFNADRHDRENHEHAYTGLSELLEAAVSRLPADQRSVILLRDYEGYSYEDISSITGLSESQVKVYIFRGRMFLKNFLGSIEAVI